MMIFLESIPVQNLVISVFENLLAIERSHRPPKKTHGDPSHAATGLVIRHKRHLSIESAPFSDIPPNFKAKVQIQSVDISIGPSVS